MEKRSVYIALHLSLIHISRGNKTFWAGSHRLLKDFGAGISDLLKGMCFNRKEAKDHGEGGSMVGYKPQDGDSVAIVEDVVTAGTAVRESIELFKHVADVNIKALFVSVDRMHPPANHLRRGAGRVGGRLPLPPGHGQRHRLGPLLLPSMQPLHIS